MVKNGHTKKVKSGEKQSYSPQSSRLFGFFPDSPCWLNSHFDGGQVAENSLKIYPFKEILGQTITFSGKKKKCGKTYQC